LVAETFVFCYQVRLWRLFALNNARIMTIKYNVINKVADSLEPLSAD